MRNLACLALALLLAAGGSAVAGYDRSWFRTPFWSGEYPNGFTVESATTVKVRAEPDPDAAAEIDCPLEAGATYHPWNFERVGAEGLEFTAWHRRIDYQVTEPIGVLAFRESDNAEVTLDLAEGERWTYLAYQQEGWFLWERAGETYSAGQELVEASGRLTPEDGRDVDEWMRITCSGGSVGWLLYADVAGGPGIAEPNITGYGSAEDRR